MKKLEDGEGRTRPTARAPSHGTGLRGREAGGGGARFLTRAAHCGRRALAAGLPPQVMLEGDRERPSSSIGRRWRRREPPGGGAAGLATDVRSVSTRSECPGSQTAGAVAGDIELGRLAAQAALLGKGKDRTRKPPASRPCARAEGGGEDSDHRDYLWLGQLASLGGSRKPRRRSVGRVRDGTAPENWATLVLFLAQTDTKKAEAELSRRNGNCPGISSRSFWRRA
jgi:hypothetical protein